MHKCMVLEVKSSVSGPRLIVITLLCPLALAIAEKLLTGTLSINTSKIGLCCIKVEESTKNTYNMFNSQGHNFYKLKYISLEEVKLCLFNNNI